MATTAMNLHVMAAYVNLYGVHTGDQFAAPDDQLDICAIAYVVAEDRPAPPEFYTDEIASIRLIESSARAMAAIRAISDTLDSDPCETEIAPGHTIPDYIEHVSNWAATPPIGATKPPSTSEVIGRILRAAQALGTQTTAA
ncbi:hypothetical protein [Streptomyces leeuwenhoekii]|uniref:Sle1_051 protein n=1 Tax=Streptomyces leeuwenhoekii TaxID=1437453 RepID=A0A0F7VMD0_STRLW|nr:hypothetical protein [Streptomyces leeuwenhoekii]CQR59218.1 sle1_051 [Streptomyces leeuwenhoekii]